MTGFRKNVATTCRIALITVLLMVMGTVLTGQAHTLSLSTVVADVPDSAGNAVSTALRPISSLGAHTLFVQSEGRGATPAVTKPVTTQKTGSVLLVFNGGYNGNSGHPVDSYSNRWTPLGAAVPYKNGYGDSFDVKAYIARSASGGPNHTVSIAKTANPAGEISIPFVEIRQAGILKDVVQNYAPTGFVMTSGNVTTTGPATLIAFWWGDGAVTRMTAVPNNGFAVIDSFLQLPDNSAVQCAVAFRQVSRPGTYNVSWMGAPVQGAILWLFAFQPKGTG